jgi:glycosyltransferase involved in cell wall biosynthesis
LKILFVSDVSIHHVIGGAERVLYEQTTGLANKNNQVHVLTRRLSEHQHDQETIAGVQEWRYTVDQASNLRFFLSTLAYGLRRFEELQKQHAFDCINGHQPFSTWAALRSPVARGIPFFYTCHSLSFEEFITRRQKPDDIRGRLPYLFNIALRKWIERRVIVAAHRVIVLSEFTRDKLIETYGLPLEKIVIIPGGVDIQRFQPLKDKRAGRARLGLPLDRPILFTVRNLVPRMGLENLIKAMQYIVQAIPDALLIIGGTGPLNASLLQFTHSLGLENHICFTGFIPEENLPVFFGTADAFVLPTVALEGFGLVTVEALACGIPALGTPVGGTKEILERFDPSFLFRDTSPEALTELIVSILRQCKDNPAFAESITRKCRKFVEDHYSWQINITATERLLKDASD